MFSSVFVAMFNGPPGAIGRKNSPKPPFTVVKPLPIGSQLKPSLGAQSTCDGAVKLRAGLVERKRGDIKVLECAVGVV